MSSWARLHSSLSVELFFFSFCGKFPLLSDEASDDRRAKQNDEDDGDGDVQHQHVHDGGYVKR